MRLWMILAGMGVLAMAAAGAAGAAGAGEIKPAIVFDHGGKFDKGFNESVADGAERFRHDTGIAYDEFVPTGTGFVAAHRRFAKQGANPIIAVGFDQTGAVAKVAREFPHTSWIVIDGVVDRPNVQSVVFKEQEGSFLVGMAAALATKSGKIGFIGGMDVPPIRRFACGYAQGAKYADPKLAIVADMIGTTAAAWNDPVRARALAQSQFRRGVDVVYAAAGASGLAVYQAAADAKKLAIGSDRDQDDLHPGTMLTSMVKRVDVAAYTGLMAARAGRLKPGVTRLGLKEGGVDWALDPYNEKLIMPAMKARILAAKADIIAGRIKVADDMADHRCPY